MRIVFLDSFAADQGAPGWTEVAALGDLALFPRTSPEAVIERSRGATAIITNKVVLGPAQFDALPELRYVGVSATGTNIIDIDAARARGIAVTNVPGYSTESVAQLVFALLMHLTTAVAPHDAATKRGDWARSPDFCLFLRPLTELAGKTLVIVGKGAIGGAVARIGEAFGMQVIAAAVPGRPGTPNEPRVPLAEALGRADVVSLHCPLSPATNKLVNESFFAQLKPGAILINTSRGGLIDEAALQAALASGRLGGAGLDVLASEPPPAGHPLLAANAPWADRLVVTPHIAWGTTEARLRLQNEVARNLAAFQQGQRRNRVD
ncbi:MAG TPA: D-2-hydroxyacid dehydrogenase [Polyangia bacterium]